MNKPNLAFLPSEIPPIAQRSLDILFLELALCDVMSPVGPGSEVQRGIAIKNIRQSQIHSRSFQTALKTNGLLAFFCSRCLVC